MECASAKSVACVFSELFGQKERRQEALHVLSSSFWWQDSLWLFYFVKRRKSKRRYIPATQRTHTPPSQTPPHVCPAEFVFIRTHATLTVPGSSPCVSFVLSKGPSIPPHKNLHLHRISTKHHVKQQQNKGEVCVFRVPPLITKIEPFDRTSNQSRIPAEFKHITKRRKRN